MIVYEHQTDESKTAREHPWTEGENNPEHLYYDFKEHSELISSVLEDFRVHAKWPAVETFYNLLRWLNGPNSYLESNDCAFRGCTQNTNLNFKKQLCCTGRLMILFQETQLNLAVASIGQLKNRVHFYLSQIDRDFDLGVVGTSILPVYFKDLNLPEEQKYGYELMLSFWTWGDDESETMENLDRLFRGLNQSIEVLSNEIGKAMKAREVKQAEAPA